MCGDTELRASPPRLSPAAAIDPEGISRSLGAPGKCTSHPLPQSCDPQHLFVLNMSAASQLIAYGSCSLLAYPAQFSQPNLPAMQQCTHACLLCWVLHLMSSWSSRSSIVALTQAVRTPATSQQLKR